VTEPLLPPDRVARTAEDLQGRLLDWALYGNEYLIVEDCE
jgi:hypothetical protein